MLRESGTPVNRARLEVSCALAFLFLIVAANSLPQRYSRNQRTIRLCSKSLSDALYLVCHDRGGYNEPYSYSSEDEIRTSSGPGLVEECCYRPCSYEQLEQYCKPLRDDKNDHDDSQDGIEEYLRIVNLPYPSMRKLATGSRRAATSERNNAKTNVESKNALIIVRDRTANDINKGNSRDRVNRYSPRKEFLGSLKNDRDESDVVANANEACDFEGGTTTGTTGTTTTTRLVSRRHERPEDSILVETRQREIEFASVPKFMTGTTLPDPSDAAIFLFPSRTNVVLERAAKDLAAITDLERLIERDSIRSRSYTRRKTKGKGRKIRKQFRECGQENIGSSGCPSGERET